MTAATDGMSRPPHDHQHQADDEEDDPDRPQRRDLQQKSGDEKDDSENDYGVHLVSIQMEVSVRARSLGSRHQLDFVSP